VTADEFSAWLKAIEYAATVEVHPGNRIDNAWLRAAIAVIKGAPFAVSAARADGMEECAAAVEKEHGTASLAAKAFRATAAAIRAAAARPRKGPAQDEGGQHG
jgi:hypothetical protein